MSCPLGASYLGEGRCYFVLWAPNAKRVAVRIVKPASRTIEMQKEQQGYHQVLAEGVEPGSLYYYVLDGKTEKPDPASHYQPEGIHGSSEVIDQSFDWTDVGWRGLDLEDYVIYEIHVGTYSEKGTFESIIPHLDGLRELGISAIELMPVGQFPGDRNWGYDGAYPFAVQNSYGGPAGLKKLVDACHARGLAVVLDVVYNHLGPEGNYLALFGPYFTERYRTPWGPAINFDGPESDGVRRYFIENALYWTKEFHFDALRLDAIHAIVDPSARPILEELGMAVHRQAEELERKVYVIAESDRNDSRIIRSRETGGYGLDAQWSDDFHHSVHALLTGERNGYYQDFGKIEHLAKAYREGFVYSGQYSEFRRRRHGNSSRDLPPQRFVVFAQNHDQVGNRLMGDRLNRLVSFEASKLALGAVLLSPFTPLLFMGEEYGETAAFMYFVSHSDPALIQAVREGRQDEFAAFNWEGQIPDPQDVKTFQSCKLNQGLRFNGDHLVLYDFVRELIRLRKELPALSRNHKGGMEVLPFEREKLLWIRRWQSDHQAVILLNFGDESLTAQLPSPKVCLRKVMDSADQRWHGRGSTCPDLLEADRNVPLSIVPNSLVLFHSN